MACGASWDTEEEQDRLYKLGVIQGHAYSLLKAAEVEDSAGEKVKIVQIRNPWGKFEWKGDWSDDSNIWSDSAKKIMGFV